jgi:hypothetical protein
MQPTARKRKSPEVSELDNEHIDLNMTVKEFMESQMNRFATQIRDKANTLTTKLRCDFDADKLDIMAQLDDAALLFKKQKVEAAQKQGDVDEPKPVLPPSTTTDVASDSTDNAAPVSSTSASASSTTTTTAPASASATITTIPSSSTTTPDRISQIILQVMDKLPQKGEKSEEILNPYKGQTFQLPYSTRRRYLVGRSTGKKYTDKGLSLSEDGEVSTCHGDFRTQKGKICFVDLDSTNGSYLNGNKLTPHEGNPLQPGDVLSLGATKMKVSFA